MSAKDLFLDFLNYLFIVLLSVFLLLFFIKGDRLILFVEFMRAFLPLAFFGLIFLIKLKMGRLELARAKEEARPELVLYLNYLDKFKSDLLVFSVPIITIVIALLGGDGVDLVDFFQATLLFLIVYLWQNYLFKKRV